MSARPRRPSGLLRRAGTRNAAFAAHEISRNPPRPQFAIFHFQYSFREARVVSVCGGGVTGWAVIFREAREAGISCAAKAAFRVWRHGETRRVLAEALRRPTKSRPGARPTAANRRQAIRHAARFVVARSATPSKASRN